MWQPRRNSRWRWPHCNKPLPSCLARWTAKSAFPMANAVAWREILANLERPNATVLVKGNEEVRLLPLRALIASLSPERRYA
jgi:hypothetical protein